jgi:HSP20 family protein
MASVTRWEPFGLDLPTWMERLFDERPAMRVEEFMEDGVLVVRAEMPDVDIDKDVDISVHDGLLHIKAQRTLTEEKKDKTYFRSEFHYGAFERTLPLPPGATVDDVKATYEDGVVEIRIPAPSEPKVAKVPVQRV